MLCVNSAQIRRLQIIYGVNICIQFGQEEPVQWQFLPSALKLDFP